MKFVTYTERIQCFDSIRISPEKVTDKGSKGIIELKGKRVQLAFEEIFSYNEKIITNRNLAGLSMAASAINFTLFSKELILDFPVTEADLKFLKEMVRINNI
ncbi:hypothetical protein B1A_21273, partial [mine drainage metagenome]